MNRNCKNDKLIIVFESPCHLNGCILKKLKTSLQIAFQYFQDFDNICECFNYFQNSKVMIKDICGPWTIFGVGCRLICLGS